MPFFMLSSMSNAKKWILYMEKVLEFDQISERKIDSDSSVAFALLWTNKQTKEKIYSTVVKIFRNNSNRRYKSFSVGLAESAGGQLPAES